MNISNDFRILRQFKSGATVQVCRCLRVKDNQAVILKWPRQEHPSNQVINNLQHEYHLLKKISSEGVIQAYEMIDSKLIPVLVLEDMDGISLKEFLNGNALELSLFFRIAIQLVEIVQSLHQAEIIHKDINPSNIVINPETYKIKLIDLSISSHFKEEFQEELNPELFEGTLPYISPEQSGRMNRPIDYRTDFYSLGVTFFELLTGKLPFESDDALEVIYHHIAVIPPEVQNLNPAVPLMLGKLVARLLSKNPEDRYAHAKSLKTDLENCYKQWQQHKTIEPFILAEHDVQDQLRVSHKVYGREKQVIEMLKLFDETCQGRSGLLLISGEPGVGKTSLVNEIHKPITQSRAYFIKGKFDQLKSAKPYATVALAFKDLVKQILAEPEHKLIKIRDELTEVIKDNAQILINVIPEIELLLGKQRKVTPVNAIEARNRFNYIFQSFINVIANKSHPLVLFLDDLQWADAASLTLLETILISNSQSALLVIGAYRDKEVEENSMLVRMINRLKQTDIPCHELVVKPLTQDDVTNLLRDTLSSKKSTMTDLAKLITNKTNGNPFFVYEFLKTLHDNDLLYFSYDDASWHWDTELIRKKNITDNVVGLLIEKIQKLPFLMQEILKYAACIGFTFDLQTLSLIVKQTLPEIVKSLSDLASHGLVIPLGNSYKDDAIHVNQQTVADYHFFEEHLYQFSHDRIQQASYSLISEQHRSVTHLKIGQLLIAKRILHEDDEKLYVILDHLNKGIPLITRENEKIQIATYNLWAGKKAKAAIAYQLARRYFKSGLSLLNNKDWQENQSLMFELQLEYLEALYLVGTYKKADKIFDQTLSKIPSAMAKATYYLVKIRAYGSIDEYQQQFELCVHALALFNYKLPNKVGNLQVLTEIVKIFKKIRRTPPSTLAQTLRPCNSEVIAMILVLLTYATAPQIFLGNEKMIAYLITRSINLSFEHGYTEDSSATIFIFANILIEKFEKFKLAFEFVQLGEILQEKAYSPIIASKNELILAYYIEPWRKHLKDTLPYYRKSLSLCIETGNLEYAVHNSGLDVAEYSMGKNLIDMLQTMKKTQNFVRKLGNKPWETYLELLQLFIKSFQGETIETARFDNQIDLLWNYKATFLAVSSYMRYSQYLYIMNNYAECYAWAMKFLSKMNTVKGLFKTIGMFFYILSGLKSYATLSRIDKKLLNRQIPKLRKKISNLAKIIPDNLEFVDLLLRAEIDSFKGKLTSAASLYDQAISSAEHYNYPNFVALINESAAIFYLNLDRRICAKPYIQSAYFAYRRWGASGKCEQLRKKYASYLPYSTSDLDSSPTHTLTHTSSSQLLDIKSILKSSQAISGEIQLENLLQRLIKITIENSGAEKGILIRSQEDKFFIEAQGFAKREDDVEIESKEVNDIILPISIIEYVERTKVQLIIDDARFDDRFSNDDYIKRVQPKSILCLPLLSKGKLTGILYLENNLTTGIFNPERITALNMLTHQIVVSLDNALIFRASERFVPKQFLHLLDKPNIQEVKLGDSIEREITVLFNDIRNFTALIENSSPKSAFNFINRYWQYMAPIIRKNNGYIDQYLGDGLLAVFPYKRDDALIAAIEMRKKLVDFNKKQLELNERVIDMGCSINTGPAMLGIIGEKERYLVGIISDVANTASRIESLNKVYHSHILLNGDTAKPLLLTNSEQLRQIDIVVLKGKALPTEIYEVIELPKELPEVTLIQYLHTFNKGFKLYCNGYFENAIKEFNTCLHNNPHDGAASLLIARCQDFIENGAPPNWNGTTIMIEK